MSDLSELERRPERMIGTQCRHCNAPAHHMQGRNTWLCDRHYRFTVMRATAARHQKATPSFEQLDELVPLDMECPLCGVTMTWLGEKDTKAVISLRHFTASQIKFVCRSCSTRATFAPDEFLTHDPLRDKFCPVCLHWKPVTAFYTSPRGFRSNCLTCEKARRDARYIRDLATQEPTP